MARNDEKKYQIDYEETIGHDRSIDESDNLRRTLLNLPQQSSSLNRGRKGGQHSSSSSNNSNDNRRGSDKDDGRKDNEQRRKDRDNQSKNQNQKNNEKTSNNRNQTRDGDQKTNPNTINKKVQQTGKDQIKDRAKQRASQAAKKAIRNKVGKKGASKALKAGAKLAAKAVKTLVVKGIALASKALLMLVATVGLPALLIAIGVIILVFILMTLSSSSIGSGSGVDELGEEAQELREYIVAAAQSTVDPNKPEQQQYKVPEELLAAIVQLEAWLEKPDGEQTDLDKYKELIDEFTEQLKPEFEYKSFTEWTQTRVKECKQEETETTVDADGYSVESTYCIKYGWSEPTKTEQKIELITKVVAWNGTGTYEYEGKESEWQGDDQSQTKTYRYVIKNQNFDYDFSKLDSILNSHGYELEDKKWFEYFYESATETPMGYIQWLETGVVDFNTGGGYYFDGEIIPGGGVPPQFMPYYRSAEEKYGIPWYVLAAIHHTETTFSTHPSMTSSVGAVGHMQFMPLTWIGWAYPGGTRLGNASIPDHILTDPAQIAKYGGYGTDGNGDGRADPWDVEDAIHSAAKYLKASGYLQNPRQGVRAYNHSDAYVNKVLAKAEEFKNAATYQPNGLPEVTPGMFMVPLKDALATSHFGPRWGRMHNGIDLDHPYASDTGPIVAAASGTVTHSQYMGGYGNVVIIRHDFNGTRYDTVYAHLASRAVSVNQTVAKGQFIGMMGNTGASKGAHLHFEIHHPFWTSGQPHAKNPALFISVPNA